MAEGGFHEPRRMSTASLGAVIVIHAAVLGALAMSKMETPPFEIFTPISAKLIPNEPVPPKNVELPQQQPQSVTLTRPVQQVPVPDTTKTFDPTDYPVPDWTATNGTTIQAEPLRPLPIDPPIVTPVRVAAAMAPGAQLQPPYPASEERARAEGAVSIRVTIGTDGRVRAAERVAATSDAFYRATERHALRHWRFRPATVDGRAIESVKLMRVVFQLRG